MTQPTARSVYVIGILVGLPALLVAAALTPKTGQILVAAGQTALIFAVFGLIAALIRPTGGWRGGVVVAVPLGVMLLLSAAFAGQFRAFVVHDAPILGAVVVGGAIGGLIGARLRT